MRQEEKVYIQDSFHFLISHVGVCHVYQTTEYNRDIWVVSINGRRYTETRPDCSDEYHFECKTDYGTVSVSFKRPEAF